MAWTGFSSGLANQKQATAPSPQGQKAVLLQGSITFPLQEQSLHQAIRGTHANHTKGEMQNWPDRCR